MILHIISKRNKISIIRYFEKIVHLFEFIFFMIIKNALISLFFKINK